MKFINVTNSHARLVMEQLAHTDAEMVSVYTAGTMTIIYTIAPKHIELILNDKTRAIKDWEKSETINYFIHKIDNHIYDINNYQIIESSHLIEISFPKI